MYVWHSLPRRLRNVYCGLAVAGSYVFTVLGEDNQLVMQVFFEGLILLIGFSLWVEVKKAVVFFGDTAKKNDGYRRELVTAF